MKYHQIKYLSKILLPLLISVILAGNLFAQNLADDLAESFTRIDALRDAGSYRQALTALETMRSEHPGEVEILRRLADTHVDLGETASNANSEENHYTLAADLALAAITADSTSALAYFSGAVAYGRKALISGTGEKIKLSRFVKEYSEKAIALDPELAGAYHTLARWHREVAGLGFFTRTIVRMVYGGLPEASNAEAVKYFLKAISVEDNIINRLELGRTYMVMDKDAKAIETLRLTLQMTPIDPDDTRHQAEAQQLLNSLL